MAIPPPCTPVRNRKCATCVLRPGAERWLGIDRLGEIQSNAIRGVNQLCHSALDRRGRQRPIVCRGAREYQLMIWCRMGLIDAPTDEALASRMRECLGSSGEGGSATPTTSNAADAGRRQPSPRAGSRSSSPT